MTEHIMPDLAEPEAPEGTLTVLMKQAGPGALATVIKLSKQETQLGYKAATYILDRILGPPKPGGITDPWEEILEDLKNTEPEEGRPLTLSTDDEP